MDLLPAVDCAEADNSFGPLVPTSCRAFDFTLLFENIFLSLLPSAALVLASSFRLWKIRHAGAGTTRALLQFSKQVRHYLKISHNECC